MSRIAQLQHELLTIDTFVTEESVHWNNNARRPMVKSTMCMMQLELTPR